MRSTLDCDLHGNKFTIVTVINGNKGWRKDGEMKATELPAKVLADERWAHFSQSMPFAIVPLKGKDSKSKTEAVADVKVGGKPAAGVRVTGPDGKGFTIYFDKESGLPIKSVADIPDLQSPGREFTQEIYYSDYEDFGGVMRAKKIEIKRADRTVFDMQLGEFRVLDKVDDKTFAKPE